MIRFAGENDRAEIRSLFELCFPDDGGFNAYFFEHVFQPSRTLLAEEGGRLCAMLQMLPYRMSIGGEIGEATYIYGACTHPEHRRKHWMARLLEASFEEDWRLGCVASFLIPQEEWLFEFYRPFGYLPAFSLKRETALQGADGNADVRRLDDWRQAANLYRQETAKTDCWIERSEADWRTQFALFDALGAGVFGLFEGKRLRAYAFVWREKDGLFAQELLADSAESAQTLAETLRVRLGGERLQYCTIGDESILGCLKPYHAAPTRGYINLMFQ